MKLIAKLNSFNLNKAIGKGIYEEVQYIFEKECLVLDEYGRVYNNYYMNKQDARKALNWCVQELRSLYVFHNIVER